MRRRRISPTSNISENFPSANHSLFFRILVIDAHRYEAMRKFQKLDREILNDAIPKIILSNIDSLSKVMNKFQKLFENIFIEDKNRNKIIYQTRCFMVPSCTEEDNFWSANAPKARTFRSGLRNNKRNRDLLPHVSRRCFDKDVKLTYYMHEMISMGRVDRISVFETVVEEGRERRE